jgi:hypothetical protein
MILNMLLCFNAMFALEHVPLPPLSVCVTNPTNFVSDLILKIFKNKNTAVFQKTSFTISLQRPTLETGDVFTTKMHSETLKAIYLS